MQGTTARGAAIAARTLTTLAGAALVGWALAADARWAERHVLAAYCATSRGEWVVARAVPWLAAAVGLIAMWKLAPAAGKLAERVSARKHAGPLARVAVAVVAAVLVGEGIARGLHDRLMLGARATPGDRDGAPMTRFEPRLGWSYVPGRTTWTRLGGRPIAYAIDGEGDRAASSDDRPDPARPTVLFAGESIAFGYGLPWDETFPYLVGHDLGIQAVNLAVVGYGSDQAHLRVLDALPRFARPLAVVTVFIPDQIARNVDPWRARLGLGPDGALVAVPASRGPRIAKLLRQLPWHDDEPLRVTAAILRATAEAARARGAFPLFVVTNYGPACVRDGRDGEAWVVEELFVRQGLPYVRVDLDPEDLLPGLLERHPSERGTRKIASAVERALSHRLGLSAGRAAVPDSAEAAQRR